MTVSDYVRKRRMSVIAKEIRAGRNYLRTASRYGYKSPTGLMRAFLKEYLVTPAEYRNGEFYDLEIKGENKYCNKIQMGIFHIRPLKVEVTVSFERYNQEREEELCTLWKQIGVPLKPSFRSECNREVREDKVAFGHLDGKKAECVYMIADVVKSFRGKEENKLGFEIKDGKYAIFQTDNISDEKYFFEIRKLFQEMIRQQWMTEQEEMVDRSRLLFERYVNQKMYLYVPVK